VVGARFEVVEVAIRAVEVIFTNQHPMDMLRMATTVRNKAKAHRRTKGRQLATMVRISTKTRLLT
jgi:hypothetical protein